MPDIKSTSFQFGGNSVRLLEVTADPSAGAGIAAPIGSIASRDNGGVGELWQKQGAADVAWAKQGGNPLILSDGTAVPVVSAYGKGLLNSGGSAGPGAARNLLNQPGIVSGFSESTFVASAIAEVNNYGKGGLASGFAKSFYGYSYVYNNGYGGMASGYAHAWGQTGYSYARVANYGSGGFAHGYAKTAENNKSEASIICGGAGGFAGGSAYSGYGPTAGYARIYASGSGAFASGDVRSNNSGNGQLYAGSAGSFAMGSVYGTGFIRSNASAAHAWGRAYDGTIEASYDAAIAHGVARGGGNAKISAYKEGSHASGYVNDGLIRTEGKGARAFGYAKANSLAVCEIQALGNGSFAFGHAQYGGKIYASDFGGFAGGNAQGGGGLAGTESVIKTGPLAEGAFAFGNANTAGNPLAKATIEAIEHGSWVGGYVRGFGSSTGKIETLNHGALAHGECEGDDVLGPGLLSAGYATDGKGAHAFGRAKGGSILSRSHGSFVTGYAYDAGVLEVNPSGDGSVVFGFARGTGSSIKALDSGCFAGGEASSGGNIRATNIGAFAFGRTSGGSIYANGRGSHASGYCDPGDTISSGAYGSFAHGYASGFDITSSGKGSAAFGFAAAAGIVASADNSFQFGEGTNAVANSLQVGSGFQARANGQFGGANVPLTLGAAATTFATLSNMMTITGDGGANTVATITGGFSGQEMTLIFVDALVTITDDNSHAANTIDLSAAFTSADDTTLKIAFDGTSWYEISRSAN